jgi:hypothetical protein
MGWTYTRKPNHISVKDYLINYSGCFKWSEDSPYRYTVLDSAIVNLTTFYAAVERVHKTTGEREVWAAVFLLGYGRRSFDDHNFGWKDMDERCGPVESSCPERILKLLTPTDNEYANEWRKRCWANIEARKVRPKIEKGTQLELYGKNYEVTRELGRKGFHIKGIDNDGFYRLSHVKARQATIKETK